MIYQARLRVPASKSDHSQGSENAPVAVVEYGDYQCPHCRRAYPIVKRLQRDLGRDLRFVFRNFPMTEIHPDSMEAARAAESAALQDRFWEMHDVLFEYQDNLDSESLFGYARALGLDVKKFARGMDSPKVEAKIMADFESGVRSGVNGTPTFFVNGIRYDADWSYPVFRQALESLLVSAG